MAQNTSQFPELQEELCEAISTIGITDLLNQKKNIGKIRAHFEEIGKERELERIGRTISSSVEDFVEAYGTIDNFAPTERELLDSDSELDNKMADIKRYHTSCDVELRYLDGKPIAIFYDLNPNKIELLSFEGLREQYNGHFDKLETALFNDAKDPKGLKRLMKNLEELRKSNLDYLKKVEVKEREFLKSMILEGKYPFFFVDGNDVYYWGDKKKAIKRIKSIAKAVSTTSEIFPTAQSPSERLSPEDSLLYALERMEEDVSSGRAMEFNPDYLSSALINRLYSITPKTVNSKGSSPLAKALGIGFVALLSLGAFWYLTRDQKSEIYKEFKRNFSNDPQTAMNMDALAEKAEQLYNNLGFENKTLLQSTKNALGNYTLACEQLGLSGLDIATLWLLTNATEANPEIMDYRPVIVEGKNMTVDLWEDSRKIPILVYTLALDFEQSPYLVDYLKSLDSNGRFINAFHRQHHLVLDKLELNTTDRGIRQEYVEPDWDYYFKYLKGKSIVVNGTKISFPLLPLFSSREMKEQFPSRTDEMVIYASQFPLSFTKFNPKTGEYTNILTQEFGKRSLKANLDMLMDWKWGKFEGTLFERIIKAYTDKDWKSYDHLDWPVWVERPDYELARSDYDGHFGEFARIFPQYNLTMTKYLTDYEPKLAADKVIDLGYRFSWGLTGIDNVMAENPHQNIPERYRLYTKALGYSGASMWSRDPRNPGTVNECVGVPVPSDLRAKLPDGRYAPGSMIGRYVYGYDSDMNPLELAIVLPNGRKIKF